jgi:regulatory protein YycH of two-component signal transduction system YycFG
MFFYREIQNIIKNWKEKQVLSGSLATDASDFFGQSVAMNSVGDRVVVGASGDERIGGSGSSGLAYVFVSGTTGWIEQHILSGSLAVNSSDEFGFRVAMNSLGDRIVVGAYRDERIGGSVSSGLAYVFVSGTTGWVEQPILSGSLAVGNSDNFGFYVSMNSMGDRIVVGASNDERTGTNNEGLAYVFVSGTGGWTEQHILSGSLAVDSDDDFGFRVAMNSIGDRIVVGAPGDEKSGGSGSSGLAYIFVSGTTGWTEQHILSGSLAVDSFDEFGYSVAINSIGDRIVVGVEGDERIGGSGSSGLAYVFVSGTAGWTEQHILSGSLAVDSDDLFGYSVAINSIGDRIVVGARQDGKIGTDYEGLTYVFVSGTAGWTEQHILSGTLTTNGDDFGNSVAINSTGDRIIVGADRDEGISGSISSGLAYVFDEE